MNALDLFLGGWWGGGVDWASIVDQGFTFLEYSGEFLSRQEAMFQGNDETGLH